MCWFVLKKHGIGYIFPEYMMPYVGRKDLSIAFTASQLIIIPSLITPVFCLGFQQVGTMAPQSIKCGEISQIVGTKHKL